MPDKPHVGLHVLDPDYPGDPWEVEQVDDQYVYLRRLRDGRLFHHSRTSWARSREHGWLRTAADEHA